MIYYLNNSTSFNLTITNFKLIGEKKLQEIGSKPVYNPRYKGRILKNRHPEICKLTGGDCFEFVKKFLDIFWI